MTGWAGLIFPTTQAHQKEQRMTARSELIFVAEMSVRYHRSRASFLGRISTLMNLVNLSAGASAFVVLLGDTTNNLAPKLLTFVVATIGIAQALFRMDDAAAEHRLWLAQWTRLLSDIRTNETPSQVEIQEWVRRRYDLDAACVTEMRALQVDCCNRTIAALDLDGQPQIIPFHIKLLKQWFVFDRVYAIGPSPKITKG